MPADEDLGDGRRHIRLNRVYFGVSRFASLSRSELPHNGPGANEMTVWKLSSRIVVAECQTPAVRSEGVVDPLRS